MASEPASPTWPSGPLSIFDSRKASVFDKHPPFLDVQTESRTTVARIFISDRLPAAQAEAAAKLFVVAGELHANLKDAVGRLRTCATRADNEPWAVDVLVEPFEIALAKAEGRA